MRRGSVALLLIFLFALPSPVLAADVDRVFQPDSRSVRRYGPAYRYPQAGWIVLHIEGEPYERGYQHGRLLAEEIVGYLRCFAALQSPKAPTDGWKNTRSLVNALFLRRYDQEYLEEMKGIADGATAAGARFDNRPLDLVDIAGINAWAEVETLDSALEATPTGLEGIRFPHAQPRAMPPPRPMHCSAFAATGPATADGKIVFGHITMFALYPSLFYNIWLDVKPARGQRILMQSYPGGIQSGLDYYLNDAGLLVCETTIRQTRFDIKGQCLASRIRQALQYADSIDKAVAILKKDNNGLYANEWLLADIKTNEIAMFELGTHKSRLYRSSKNDWFGGTEGFYWGCNNTKDLEVRLETVASVTGRPANMVWRPAPRDQVWLQLYHQHKGKIDADFGKTAFTTPFITAYHSLDAKFTTSAMAKELKSWALFGPPLGKSWQPTQEERQLYPEIRPLVSNPWTVLHGAAPAKDASTGFPIVDLPDRVRDTPEHLEEEKPLPTEAAWHGTLLPRSDADTWLAAAFADYEKIVALEKALQERTPDQKLTPDDRERLGLKIFAARANYLAAARARGDVPLAKTQAHLTQDHWYHLAAGKGLLALHELRQLVGEPAFTELMDSFGRAHAGKEVTVAVFQAHVKKSYRPQGVSSQSEVTDGFFDYWLNQPGLPSMKLGRVEVENKGKNSYVLTVEVILDPKLPAHGVEVTVETDKGETTRLVHHRPDRPSVTTIETTERPRRVVLDKYGLSAKANGGVFSLLSFHAELEQTLIVYGTRDERHSQREAAEVLQRAIRERWSNYTVPVKSDEEVTENDLKSRHLLLVGRPDSNRVVERFQTVLPVTFGSRSFVVRHETYAHPGSAVIAAAENPLAPRYSLVVFAGLGAESTLQASAALMRRGQAAGEVLVLPQGGKPRTLVAPPRELVQELK